MAMLDKAEILYLRGFNSAYIKRRTGISMQSLLKQLRAKGVVHAPEEVVQYQILYIRAHYSSEDVEAAYRHIIMTVDDPTNAKRGRNIEVLGCGFGNYPAVFRAIIGDTRYKQLRDECWKDKQQASVKKLYGVDNVFQKETFDQFVSKEAVARGREKREMTLIDRYGVSSPNANSDIAARMVASCKKTNMERRGVEFPTQDPEVAAKVSEHRQNTMLMKYGKRNTVEVTELRNKIFDSRRKHGTLNTSSPEILLGCMLKEQFGEDVVLQNVIVDARYPYHVDYYIKPLDLFIELNGDKCHNDHWFDADNERDVQVLTAWRENMERIESETGKPSRYRKYIHTWTVTDVAKRQAAMDAGLNYLVFWDGGHCTRNGIRVPRLRDALDWFAAGCPMPQEWHKENTY